MTHRTGAGPCLRVLVSAVIVASPWSGATPSALSPDSAPALAAPSGNIVNVSSVAQLQAAFASLSSNRTIVIAPGTYNLTSTLWINGTYTNLTIRGATNNRDDVVLVGKGMGVSDANVPFGIWAGGNVTGLTIANLTIRDIYQHPIIFNAGTQAPRVYNVHLINAGQQFLKSNPDGAGGGVNNGIVEYSVFEYTNAAIDDYTNGVDVHTGQNWVIRNNLFRRIRSPQGFLAGPAILMWNNSSGSIAEGNTFIDCQREISFGLIERTPNDHTGGIIRNNFIYRAAAMGGDVGIGVMDSPGTTVANNTIFLNGQYPNAIEYRFPDTTGALVLNNLGDRGVQARDGATGSAQGNIATATAAWFVNAAAADLHLAASATGAIDKGIATTAAPLDWDAQSRPSGGGFDVGGDEYDGTSTPADTVAPFVSLTSPPAGTVSGTVTVGATANDNVGVAGVRFTLDNANLGSEDLVAPYSVNWTTAAASNGAHTLRAIARDASGNSTTSTAVTVTVSNTTPDTTAPSVTLTAPGTNGTVKGVVTVSATASDNVGVTGVRFTVDSMTIGAEDATAPYTVSWITTGSSNGTHTLRAIARDAAGNTRTSSGTIVTVNNVQPDTTPPSVSISAPATGASVSDPVAMAANATDNVGVAGVQFRVDGQPVGAEDRTAPYQTTWSPSGTADGLHTISATARDAAGNTTTSSIVTITVRAATARGVAGDVNGDGKPDLWFEHITGQLYSWFMSGAQAIGGGAPSPSSVDPVWQIVAADDFNGDAASDLLWQNTATGQLVVWVMDGLLKVGQMDLLATATPWRAVASADFNRDGHTDIVWHHPVTGQTCVWLLDGAGQRIGGDYISSFQQDVAWKIVGAADVNLDGRPDLVWQNEITGILSVWLMNGLTITQVMTAPSSPAPAWVVRAVADFDGDGRPDFVFRNASSGQLYVWYMNGVALRNGEYLTPSQPALAWQIVGGR